MNARQSGQALAVMSSKHPQLEEATYHCLGLRAREHAHKHDQIIQKHVNTSPRAHECHGTSSTTTQAVPWVGVQSPFAPAAQRQSKMLNNTYKLTLRCLRKTAARKPTQNGRRQSGQSGSSDSTQNQHEPGNIYSHIHCKSSGPKQQEHIRLH